MEVPNEPCEENPLSPEPETPLSPPDHERGTLISPGLDTPLSPPDHERGVVKTKGSEPSLMGPVPYYYMNFTYSFAGLNPEVGHLDAITTKSLLLANLKTFFGDSVAGLGFDLLVFRPGDRHGIIRCPASIYVKVRAALTLPAQFDQEIVSFRVVKASPLLTALLADSRSYEHKNYFTAKRKLHMESYSEEEEMDSDGS